MDDPSLYPAGLLIPANMIPAPEEFWQHIKNQFIVKVEYTLVLNPDPCKVYFKDTSNDYVEPIVSFLQKFQRVRPPRPTWNHYFISQAITASTMATCTRASVGAVAVLNRRIIATGFNGAPSGAEHCSHPFYTKPEDDPDMAIVQGRYSCIRAIHAEANVIAFAAKYGTSLKNSILYTTTYPCLGCLKQMISAGIDRVIYSSDYYNDPVVQKFAKECNFEVVNINDIEDIP
jgi:dCMP deaminase